jgi:hypothetical protein
MKSELLKAHAIFYRNPAGDHYPEIRPMQAAFAGIARVLFDAGILTVELLKNELGLLVLESAISGGWWHAPIDTREEIFPGHYGHREEWNQLCEQWHGMFAAETAEWHSRLLEREAIETPTEKREEPIVATHQNLSSSPTVLKETYIGEFPDVMILDICWAARQRYREWVRWIGGDLKAGCKPDRAFRAILTSGKRPLEYRPEPRPKGWK